MAWGHFICFFSLFLYFQSCCAQVRGGGDRTFGYPVKKTEEEWRRVLSEEQYRILREQGTEPAFTGRYWAHREEGVYFCGACGVALFLSDDKFDSKSGWPSFLRPKETASVENRPDHSHGRQRTEVVCASCGGHLGHVFDDGPQPTGKRYCINSASLNFEGKKKKKDK